MGEEIRGGGPDRPFDLRTKSGVVKDGELWSDDEGPTRPVFEDSVLRGLHYRTARCGGPPEGG